MTVGSSGRVGADAAARTITFVMRTDDLRLSGSIIAGSTETAIQEGTFTGSTLAFKSVQRDGESKRLISCLGTLIEDSIAFSCTADGNPELEEFVVTRQQNQNQ